MKRIFMCITINCITIVTIAQQVEPVKDSFYLLTPIEVKSIRAGELAPFTKTNIGLKEITKSNLGQDIPFLLNQTPSVIVHSDAGNGIGYTGIRIRGTDATRINITLNGIPYNDAESQGTFFVNLPDFLSSAGSIQIQRGVGTSSNGAGAFGASINLSTNELQKEAYAEVNNSVGSFNSWKHTIKLGSGLKNGFSTDVRFSRITSDGFIDRANSKLQAVYFSQAYTGKTNSFRINVFTGKEKTYHAWYGISENDLQNGNRTINYAGTEKPGDPYQNETDNYTQTHYQFFYNQKIKQRVQLQTAFFLTRGKGYYEQYKADNKYSKYNLPNPVNGTDTTFKSDFIRQLWLNNKFYGTTFSLQYKKSATEITLGGGLTRYEGRHFGKVIWAEKGLTGLYTWYNLPAQKNDANIFLKQQTKLSPNWYLFYDLQFRHVDYQLNGFRDNPNLTINRNYSFFNPKGGLTYLRNKWKAYLSYGIAQKEPNRDDFEAGKSQLPLPEKLNDLEIGIEKNDKSYSWSSVFYFMNYKNQLVLTGQINDVGAYTRTNIPNSYRAGIELQGQLAIYKWMNISGNITFSENKIRNFSEYIDDYDNGGQKIISYPSSTLAFSPSITAAATLNFLPTKNVMLSFLSKYASRQYLDNTKNSNRSLNDFYVQDFKAAYTIHNKIAKEINLIAQVNNLFDKKYEPNGYTYSYVNGGQITTENYYFPMAGMNIMVGVNVKW